MTNNIFIVSCLFIIAALRVESACPEYASVIDLCETRTVRGNSLHIDSVKMKDGFDQCSCNLTTNIPRSLTLREAVDTTQCLWYWYNATVPLKQDLHTIAYMYRNGRCVFPLVHGTVSPHAPPWTISISRKSEGLITPMVGDPGFCLQVSSTDGRDTVSTPPTTTTTLSTTSSTTSSTSPSTTPETTGDSVTAVIDSETTTTLDDNVTTSASPTSVYTATADSLKTGSTETTKIRDTASVDDFSPPTDTTTTFSVSAAEKTSLTTVTTNVITSTVSTTVVSTSTQGDVDEAQDQESDNNDGIIIGATVAGVVLFVILLSACVYMSRKMTRKYTTKDIEDIVYLPQPGTK